MSLAPYGHPLPMILFTSTDLQDLPFQKRYFLLLQEEVTKTDTRWLNLFAQLLVRFHILSHNMLPPYGRNKMQNHQLKFL